MAKSSLFRLSYRQKFKFFQKKTGFWIVWLFLGLLFQPTFAKAETQILPVTELFDIQLPEDELISLDGQAFSFANARNEKALLINIWATWCAPCVVELPELEEAAQKLADDKIKVVLISVDRKGLEHAQSFLDERAIKTPLSLHSPMSEWARTLGLRGLPSSFLISADQRKIYSVQGAASWADEAILDEIRALIAP